MDLFMVRSYCAPHFEQVLIIGFAMPGNMSPNRADS
jgi:hypothetical protein